MRELALNILDIAQNSVRAQATAVRVDVTMSIRGNLLGIRIADDGKGMSPELLARVTDPFATTRTTRKVGMGLPLLRMDAELCGGTFDIESTEGIGTRVETTYELDHIDRPPLGDLAGTCATLIGGAPEIRWVFAFRTDDGEYVFDTDEVRAALDGVPIETPEILLYLTDMLTENIEELKGGKFL